MSALCDLISLVQARPRPYDVGVVVSVDGQRASVKVGARAINCTTVVEVSPGDKVRVQGLLIVSKQQNLAATIPVFRA